MKNKIPKSGAGRPLKYPFDKMKVGDCLTVVSISAIVSAYAYGKRIGKKFVQRNGGTEVWREK